MINYVKEVLLVVNPLLCNANLPAIAYGLRDRYLINKKWTGNKTQKSYLYI